MQFVSNLCINRKLNVYMQVEIYLFLWNKITSINMKTLIKATLTIGLITLFATSCTSRKQHCDAYGAITKVENSNKETIKSVNNELILEKKS